MYAMAEFKKVDVTIFNNTYTLRTDEDPTYITQLANHVNNKMSLMANQTRIISKVEIAVLASLHIVDEYYKFRHEIEEKVTKLIDL